MIKWQKKNALSMISEEQHTKRMRRCPAE